MVVLNSCWNSNAIKHQRLKVIPKDEIFFVLPLDAAAIFFHILAAAGTSR
jgi:hypothetical protein